MTKATIIGKALICGTIHLDSPVLISAGSAGTEWQNEADAYVLRNAMEQPFIPGTSLAGVLRRRVRDIDAALEELLFGGAKQSAGDLQSAVAIDDIMLEHAHITVRDGVGIDDYTGTGLTGAKYDYEAVERGAEGKLRIVVTVRSYHKAAYPGFTDAVKRLADMLAGGIRLGALTAKGFGRVSCRDVQALFYDFSRREDVRDWLLKKTPSHVYSGRAGSVISPKNFIVEGEFALKTSLLVRGADDDGNVAQLKSGSDFLISGTTIKGVLRHRAMYILRRLGKPEEILRGLMGYAEKDDRKKSRFLTAETYFKDGVTEAAQSRIAVDRFTCGAMTGKLFTERPVWPGSKGVPVLKIAFEIEDCAEWEAGLALLLLKDLWNGNIAVGGGASVGRGYLQGVVARVSFAGREWKVGAGGRVEGASADDLNHFVRAFAHYGREGDETT